MERGGTILSGEWRSAGSAAATPCRVELGGEGFAIVPSSGARLDPAYRDVLRVSSTPFGCTLEFDGGLSVELLRFGPSLDLLVSTVRERRTRQLLTDRLVQVPDEPLELVEAVTGDWSGRAHLVRHPWGFVLAPVEPDGPWASVRRAEIEAVDARPSVGGVTVGTGDGRSLEIRRLGAHTARHAASLRALAEGAAADAAAIVGSLLAEAPFGTRSRLASTLVDGRPASRTDLADAWEEARRAFVGTSDFGRYLDALLTASAGGEAWLAVAPVRPGAPEEPKAWFFAAHPSGLVAMEVVTPGSHATYCFRVTSQDPALPAMTAADLVATVSDALVDLRFLREPIALPAARLADGGARDYRRTVAALPSVRAARAHFVGRLVHDDGWEAAFGELAAWLASGDSGEWPGRSGQEARVADPGTESEDEGAGGTGAA